MRHFCLWFALAFSITHYGKCLLCVGKLSPITFIVIFFIVYTSMKLAPGIDVQRKLEACHRAIQSKGAIDQIMMQGMFLGLPRSGKTSTKRCLVGKRSKEIESSTGVAEKGSHVEIEKTTVQVSQLKWNEVNDLDEETVMVVDDISHHMYIEQSHSLDSIASDTANATHALSQYRKHGFMPHHYTQSNIQEKN